MDYRRRRPRDHLMVRVDAGRHGATPPYYMVDICMVGDEGAGRLELLRVWAGLSPLPARTPRPPRAPQSTWQTLLSMWPLAPGNSGAEEEDEGEEGCELRDVRLEDGTRVRTRLWSAPRCRRRLWSLGRHQSPCHDLYRRCQAIFLVIDGARDGCAEAAEGWLQDIRRGTEGLVPLPLLVVDSRAREAGEGTGEASKKQPSPLVAWTEANKLPLFAIPRAAAAAQESPADGDIALSRAAEMKMEYVVKSALCMARVELEGGCHVTYPAVTEPRLLTTPWDPALFARSAKRFREVVLLIMLESRRAGHDQGGAHRGWDMDRRRAMAGTGVIVSPSGTSTEEEASEGRDGVGREGERRTGSMLEGAAVSGDLWLHAILPFCHPFWSTDEPPFVYRRKALGHCNDNGQVAAW